MDVIDFFLSSLVDAVGFFFFFFKCSYILLHEYYEIF